MAAKFQRLVVLVPYMDVEEIKFAREIRSLAVSERTPVTLVTLVSDADSELSAKRRLATMASLVRDPLFKLDTMILWGSSWLRPLRKILNPGDLIICPAEVTVSKNLFNRQPLGKVLENSLPVPVYILEGFFQDNPPAAISLIRKVLFWAVTLMTFAGFFKLGAEIELTSTGWPGQFILVVLVFLEAGILYFWTSLAGY
jgi:hypothetical protein